MNTVRKTYFRDKIISLIRPHADEHMGMTAPLSLSDQFSTSHSNPKVMHYCQAAILYYATSRGIASDCEGIRIVDSKHSSTFSNMFRVYLWDKSRQTSCQNKLSAFYCELSKFLLCQFVESNACYLLFCLSDHTKSCWYLGLAVRTIYLTGPQVVRIKST